MNYKKHILKNGLRVMLAPMRDGNMKCTTKLLRRIASVNE